MVPFLGRWSWHWKPEAFWELLYWVYIERLKKQRAQRHTEQSHGEEVRWAHSCCFFFWTIYLLPFLGKIFHSEKVLWKSLQRQAKRCASKGSLSAVRLIDSQPQQQSQLDLMFMNASSILWLQLRTTSRSASTKESMLDMALGIIPSLIDKANIICTCLTGLLWGMGKASVLLYKETVSIEANVVRAVQC